MGHRASLEGVQIHYGREEVVIVHLWKGTQRGNYFDAAKG